MRAPRLLPRLVALVACVATALLLLTAAPADAATWRADDPRDRSTGGYGDIRQARVVAGPHRIRLRLEVQRHQAFRTSWKFDVDPGVPGPEFSADVTAGYPEIDVERWPSGRDRCAPHTVQVSDDGKVLTASFRMRCIAYQRALPTQMRVHVYTGAEAETDYDCAPGGTPPCRRWSRWFDVG